MRASRICRHSRSSRSCNRPRVISRASHPARAVTATAIISARESGTRFRLLRSKQPAFFAITEKPLRKQGLFCWEIKKEELGIKKERAEGDGQARGSTRSKSEMKITKIAQIIIMVVAVTFISPARADTVSVPSAENSAFTLDVPSGWKPKTDKTDESVDATSADGHAYMTAWLGKSSDRKSVV